LIFSTNRNRQVTENNSFFKEQATRDDGARMGLPAAPYWADFMTVIVTQRKKRNNA
jgi:hypothetical protein